VYLCGVLGGRKFFGKRETKSDFCFDLFMRFLPGEIFFIKGKLVGVFGGK